MNDPFELLPLEEIEEMDRQRSQAIESLQISDSGDSVKCQRCGMAVPIVGKLTKTSKVRIGILEKRIKWIENHSCGYNRSSIDDIKALKQKLAELLEGEDKAGNYRRP